MTTDYNTPPAEYPQEYCTECGEAINSETMYYNSDSGKHYCGACFFGYDKEQLKSEYIDVECFTASDFINEQAKYEFLKVKNKLTSEDKYILSLLREIVNDIRNDMIEDVQRLIRADFENKSSGWQKNLIEIAQNIQVCGAPLSAEFIIEMKNDL